jgi:hypothetical protein
VPSIEGSLGEVSGLGSFDHQGDRPMRRYALRDDRGERIKDPLPGRARHVGVTAKDNRLFVEAVLHRYRAGIPLGSHHRLDSGASATGLFESRVHRDLRRLGCLSPAKLGRGTGGVLLFVVGHG